MTPDELRDLLGADGSARRSKYNSRKTHVAALGRTFDSQHEARVAVWLTAREDAGEIRDLRFQQGYSFYFDGYLLCRYVADFTYLEPGPDGHWDRVVADAKGFATPLYRLKKRMMRAFHGIDIREL